MIDFEYKDRLRDLNMSDLACLYDYVQAVYRAQIYISNQLRCSSKADALIDEFAQAADAFKLDVLDALQECKSTDEFDRKTRIHVLAHEALWCGDEAGFNDWIAELKNPMERAA